MHNNLTASLSFFHLSNLSLFGLLIFFVCQGAESTCLVISFIGLGLNGLLLGLRFHFGRSREVLHSQLSEELDVSLKNEIMQDLDREVARRTKAEELEKN